MPVALFLVPFDTAQAPGKGTVRRCAASRIVPTIPASPGPDDPIWSFAETLGNHCLVKVRAPNATLDLFRAESDFVEIPFNGQGNVTAGVRAARPRWAGAPVGDCCFPAVRRWNSFG